MFAGSRLLMGQQVFKATDGNTINEDLWKSSVVGTLPELLQQIGIYNYVVLNKGFTSADQQTLGLHAVHAAWSGIEFNVFQGNTSLNWLSVTAVAV